MISSTILNRKVVENLDNIIEIKNLSKSFGTLKAVDNLSFEVRRAELFAFLGVNGAGKSTTISMLCGQLKKDFGEIIIDGKKLSGNISEIKSEIGVVFQSSVLDKQLTVRDNLKSRASLYGISGKAFDKRLSELSDMLELDGLLSRTLGKLSGGQRRKIDIARAVFHNPKILILDEPTTGLDPQTRKTVWSVVDGLRKNENMTIFLTTHYMEEAAEADYVVILDSGKIAAHGTPLELKSKYTGDFITLYGTDEETILSFGLPYERSGGAYRISVPDSETAVKLISASPEAFKDFELVKGRMDDVFLAVTGKKHNEEV